MSMHSIGTKLLVGSKGNGIFEISTQTSNIRCFQEAHSSKIRDVAFHPNNDNIYASCDDNGMLLIWDQSKHIVTKRMNMEFSMNCLCWSHDGTELLVGCINESKMAKKPATMVSNI